MEKTFISKQSLRLIISPSLLSIFFLGFSSGLPIALTSSTLQAWYTVAGVSVVTISLLTLVGQPYVYKFLWAPLLDRFVPPLLGRRRGWILISQLTLVISLAGMAFMDPSISPWPLASLALLVAFFSATQDIAIDAYRADLLQPQERGLGSAMTVGGYRLAMLFSGGLAMIMADHLGWQITYLIMAGVLALQIIVTYLSPELAVQAKPPANLQEALIDPFREFLSRRRAWVILLFIVLYKLSDAFALSLGTTFLLRGMDFSLSEVGAIYKTVAIIATIIGSFSGGLIMIRIGLYRSLLIFGFLQTAANLAFMLLAIVGKNYFVLINAIFVESFCSGLGTVAFVAFLMSLCDMRYTATQFALLSALSAVGRVFIGPFAGVIVENVGWTMFYFYSFLIGLPSLFVLLWLRDELSSLFLKQKGSLIASD